MADSSVTLYPGDSLTVNVSAGQEPEAGAGAAQDTSATISAAPGGSDAATADTGAQDQAATDGTNEQSGIAEADTAVVPQDQGQAPDIAEHTGDVVPPESPVSFG